MNGSMFRRRFAGRYFSASKSATPPWKRTGNALTSKRVIGTMPLLPSSTLRHAVSMLLPTGETMPRPVMTTRRLDKRLPHKRDFEKRGEDMRGDWRKTVDDAAFLDASAWRLRLRGAGGSRARPIRPGCGAR